MSDLLFSEYDLREVYEFQGEHVEQEFNKLTDDYVLNAPEADLVAHLVSKYALEVPQLGDPVMTEPEDADVDVQGYPGYDVRFHDEPAMVKGYSVEIHVPFSGNAQLFQCRPSTWSMNPPRADIQNAQLVFIYRKPGVMNPTEVRGMFDLTLRSIRECLKHVEDDCRQHNSELQRRITSMVAGRKQRVLKNRQAATGIGFPIKRRDGAPQTYTVPDVRRKPEIQKPVVKDKSYTPEPALPEQEYEHILSVVKGMVKVMERSPHSFRDMGEEDLRTHFLVQLNGQYEGRATGETFNYQGKTDILIRDDDRNVFIAECALWKGEAYLTEKIDQILGYLHWRDTKASIIVFNRNKSFSEVLGQIEAIVKKHSCCKKLLKKVGETEWRFLFGNKDDPNRELQLAVLLFDVPK